MTTPLALVLSCVSGYIALSYEILWYRAYSIAMMGRAQAFGVLLGGYLFGIALGSVASRVFCVEDADRSRVLRTLAFGVFGANILGFLFVPLFARLVTLPHAWGPATLLLGLSAAGLGAVFPLVAQLAVRNDSSVGRRVSYLYMANVLGSASGSLGTGLILLDHLSLAALTTLLGVVGVSCAAGLYLAAVPKRRAPRRGAVAVAVATAAAMVVFSPRLFGSVYEQLVFTKGYTPDLHFVRVIENRHGVIAVTANDELYGSGALDGVFNIDLRHDARNTIRRAYAIAALHPAPRTILIVGLSTGSWAAVIARHPLAERITIVEINPGYRQLLSAYPAVAGLSSDRRVRIEIDDVRRWLRRHRGDQFDLIVANTTYNWRANATSLLSAEFLDLVRAHLNRGGVYYYNTTGEPRVQRTGATLFPYTWRLNNMLAVSDQAFAPDFERLRAQLMSSGAAPEHALVDDVIRTLGQEVETRESILSRTAGLQLITDDNMGTEWTLARRVWTY